MCQEVVCPGTFIFSRQWSKILTFNYYHADKEFEAWKAYLTCPRNYWEAMDPVLEPLLANKAQPLNHAIRLSVLLRNYNQVPGIFRHQGTPTLLKTLPFSR